MYRRLSPLAFSLACLPPHAALAAQAGGSEAALAEIVVVAPSAQGAGLDRALVPAASAIIGADDLNRSGPASLLRGLDDRLAGVVLDEAQGDSLQPNLLYRGFEASPLAGDAQGLAVYVGGVRFNQPFGDTVNWDLIPDLAVDRMELLGSSPAFGLNALGGSLSVQLKDGFHWSGTAGELSAGSFGRTQAGVEFGAKAGDTALYAAAQGLREDGWRDHSPSRAGQFYADLGWRPAAGEFHLNLLAADTSLTGNGVTPVELLAVDRAAVFTYPDQTRNRYVRLAASGDESLGKTLSLQQGAYYAHFSQETLNGDTADTAPCPANGAVLCTAAGDALTGPGGAPIPNFVVASPYAATFPAFAAGGPYALLNITRTQTDAYGASAQLSLTRPLGAMSNHLVLGAGYDGASALFSATTTLGALTRARGYAGPGFMIDMADGSIAPVRVQANSNAFGFFVSDTLEATPRLAITLSGRFNAIGETLADQLGASLNGRHQFDRFNPAAGLTYRLPGSVTAYTGYAEANRAPTPAELSCASPQAPCSLTNFFVADPSLKQVTARTYEAGLRGRWARGAVKAQWHAGVYRTDAAADIQFVASPTLGRDYFTNIGRTRRQGVEAGVAADAGLWSVFLDYAFTDATFRTPLTLDGGQNPLADTAGLIHVRPGDHIPSVPDHSLKFGADYQATSAWSLGFSGRYAGGQYLSGDAANLTPKTKPYLVVNFETRYRLGPHVELRGWVQNLTDARYSTFGAFSPTAQVPILLRPGASDPRSLSPGQPIAGFASIRISY